MSSDERRMKILVIAYLCEPGRGSERGAGWGVLGALRSFGDCTLITGPESGAVVGAWQRKNPDAGFETETVAEPRAASILKRFRIGEFLVYLAWQRRVRKMCRQLVRSGDFDVVFHASLSAFWLPSVATGFGLPSVWGPVGGAVTTPVRLWPLLGWKGIVVELVDWIAVRFMSLLPGTRRTWRAATVRIAQNDETVARLPGAMRSGTVVLNHALFHQVRATEAGASAESAEGYVVWVSPMESRKGPELAVRALALTSTTIRMVMVGDGPERAQTEALARELEITDRIEFVGMVPHNRAIELIEEAAVAVYTGMREEGGLALAEAMLLGTSVVVLANGGAATIARCSTDSGRVSLVEPSSVNDTVSAMAAAIEHQFEGWSADPSASHGCLIDQQAAIAELERLVVAASNTEMGPEA
jgi:hypothetical protein